MQVGTNWTGSYSRFSYDEADRYFLMLKEQGKAVLDDEFNLMQEIQLNLLRRFIQDSFGDGAAGDSFKIVGTGASNDFTITGGDGTIEGAGRAYVSGYMVPLLSDVAYSAQEVAGAALTTPPGARTDEVYLDVYLDEIDSVDDPDIVDPVIGAPTSRRWKLFWQVKVAEGSVTPLPFNDANNRRHWTYKLATLNRTAQAAIDAEMVVDERRTVGSLYALLAGDPAQTFEVDDATTDTHAINRQTGDSRYAQLAVENVFTAIQHAPKFDSGSARRLKEILNEPLPTIEELARIGLYVYRWRKSGELDIGTMADEVAAVLPLVASFDDDGEPSGLDYGRAAFVMAQTLVAEVLALKQGRGS